MKKIKVIGAGIFGCCIATELTKTGYEVVLIEQDSDIMQRASKLNHNRIHFGFHYPRSPKTARQSLDGLITFLLYFKDSVVSDFPNYYMISNENSKITKDDYIYFCEKLGIGYDYEYPEEYLVDRKRIDSSLKVREFIFDYDILQSLVKSQLKDVDLRLNTFFDGETDGYDYIINTSYSNTNIISKQLGIPKLSLKFQDVIVPIFKMNHEKIGLTIMDGPFCSVMPRGNNKNEFLLYHPKYSVVSESPENNLGDIDVDKAIKKIYIDSQKFYPFLTNIDPIDYWRTIRALPINDNDERISEIFMNGKKSNYINVLSGKISTCIKIALEVRNIVKNGTKKEIIV